MNINLNLTFLDTFLLQSFFQIKAPDLEGYDIDKNGNKVTFIETNQKTTAANKSDFEEIYQREFIKSNLLDTITSHDTLKTELTYRVNEMIIKYNTRKNVDLTLITTAKEFLLWLPSYEMPSIDGNIFNNELIKQIHTRYNNVIFFTLTEIQLSNALNQPIEFGSLIRMKPNNKGMLSGLIRFLEDKCRSVEWRNNIINAINFDTEYYSRHSKEKSKKISFS